MKKIKLISFLIIACAFIACNKYKNIDPTINIHGFAYRNDPLSSNFPTPISVKPIFLNNGTDTSSYILQAKTDTAGRFTIPYISDGGSIVFVNFIDKGTVFKGSKKINASNKDSIITLNVYPIYFNGLSIKFQDGYHTLIPNLKFRLYTSRLAASVDSTQYANLIGVSDNNGKFSKYNFAPNKYYIVASANIGATKIKTLDSITITAKGLFKDSVILK